MPQIELLRKEAEFTKSIDDKKEIKCMKSKNPKINNIFSKKKTKQGIELRKYEKK